MPNLTAPHPAQDTRSAGHDTVIGAYPAAVGEQAPTLAGQREHPAGTARQPTLPGETAQLVKVIQLVFGARRAGDVPPEPARVLLDQRPAEVTGLGEGYPASSSASSHRHRGSGSAAACAGSSAGCSNRLATAPTIRRRVWLRQVLTQVSARSDTIIAASDWPSSSARGPSI